MCSQMLLSQSTLSYFPLHFRIIMNPLMFCTYVWHYWLHPLLLVGLHLLFPILVMQFAGVYIQQCGRASSVKVLTITNGIKLCWVQFRGISTIYMYACMYTHIRGCSWPNSHTRVLVRYIQQFSVSGHLDLYLPKGLLIII